jgi:WD40 repeat protein
VAAADAKPGVRIHSSSTGKITRTFTGNAPVAFARISPSGKHLISVFRDGTVRVWDLQSGEKAREFSVPVMNKGTMLAVAMSPDNAYVAVALGRQDKWSSALEIWDIGSQSLVSSLAGGRNVRTMTFSKDGRSLYVGNAVDRDGNSLSVFDIETGRQLKSFIGEMGRTVRSIVLSPDENQIVSGDSSGRVIVWDVATQQPLITLTDDGGPIVTSVDWSSDGQRIAAGRGDGTIQIWTLPRSP